MKNIFIIFFVFITCSCAFGEETKEYGLHCRETLSSVAKKLKLEDFSIQTFQDKKLAGIEMPEFWNNFQGEGILTKTKVSYDIGKFDSFIDVASLRFSTNNLIDISLQSVLIDDNKTEEISKKIAFEIASRYRDKYKKIIKISHRTDDTFFFSFHTYTFYTVSTPEIEITTGNKTVEFDSENQRYKSRVLIRIIFKNSCSEKKTNKIL